MNNIFWIIGVIFFVGVWAEITFNIGFLGLMFGWFPAYVVAHVWLSVTGCLKFNEGS